MTRQSSLYAKLRAKTGGGGIRTPVPRCFKTSFYMRSRFIIFLRLAERHATGSRFSYFGDFLPSRPEQPAQPACYLTPLPNPQARSGRTGCQIRQPGATDSCRLNLLPDD